MIDAYSAAASADLPAPSTWRRLPPLILLLTLLIVTAGLAPGQHLIAREKIKISAISFSGNQTFSDDELKKILKSRKGKEFKRRFLALDEVLVTNYYATQGFRNALVTTNVTENGNRVKIEYAITEGRRYYLQQLEFLGYETPIRWQLYAMFPIKPGAPYDRTRIDAGLNQLENYYLDNGHPYAAFTDQETVIDDSLISLNIYIEEGDTVYIDQIEYEGLKQVKRFVLRREMAFAKGSVYSRVLIEASRRNIYSTGLFRVVNYRLIPLDPAGTRTKIIWQLVEKPNLWFGLRFGVGHETGGIVTSATTFDFTVEGGHRNLAGTSRSISVAGVPSIYYQASPGRISNPKNAFTFSYVEPWILETRTPGVFRVEYSWERPPIAPDTLRIFSISQNIHHTFKNNWSYSLGLSRQQVSASRSSLNRVTQGRDLIYAASFNPVLDMRDNILNTQRGHLTDALVKFVYSTSPDTTATGETTRVTNTFVKVILQWNRYQAFDLRRDWVLATRIRAGGLVELGTTKRIEKIPITERFYLGGASTIRGYGEQGIGRQRFTDDNERIPIGGKYLLLANAELRIPLVWLLVGELFVDAGNIWESSEQFDTLDLKIGSGVGLAIVTPFGPLRFDYGVKVLPEAGESFGEFHLGISFAF